MGYRLKGLHVILKKCLELGNRGGKRMVKVAIEGYLYQDGLRIFDILDRKELEERIGGA